MRFPSFRLVIDGRVLTEQAITEAETFKARSIPRVSAAKVQAHIARGATLIVGSAEEHDQSVRSLIESLESELNERLSANLYFSPGGAEGFQVHYDTHDVVVLQLEGSKSWRLYEVTYEYPLHDQPYSTHPPPDTTPQSIRLMKGDALYVPRGLWHSARAEAGHPSLHLTIGIYRKTRIDLFEWLVNQMKHDPVLRSDLWQSGSLGELQYSLDIIRDRFSRYCTSDPKVLRQYLEWDQEQRKQTSDWLTVLPSSALADSEDR